jgi:hypothetical protein
LLFNIQRHRNLTFAKLPGTEVECAEPGRLLKNTPPQATRVALAAARVRARIYSCRKGLKTNHFHSADLSRRAVEGWRGAAAVTAERYKEDAVDFFSTPRLTGGSFSIKAHASSSVLFWRMVNPSPTSTPG